MTSTKLGAIVAMAVAGQVLAGTSKITYTLELGGDNHATAWKTAACGLASNPIFTPGTSTNGQDFHLVTSITWDVKVAVSGSHTTKGTPLGVANAVFSIELRGPSPSTALVASFGKGTTSTAGYYSTINDGTAGSNTCHGTDPNEAASFPPFFTFTGTANGRVIDTVANGGPGLDYFQYGSTQGFPAASTALSGQLLGVGAGYSKFVNTNCPSGLCGAFGDGQATGVGSTDITCGLGVDVVAEGQLNTTGLTNGTYTLTVIPGSGSNILDGDIHCDSNGGEDEGDFAVAPDDTTAPLVGSSISFIGGAGVTCLPSTVATGGRGIFYSQSAFNGNSATFNTPAQENNAIATDKTVLLPTQPASATTLANVSSFTRGINGLFIDVAPGAGCPHLGTPTGLPAMSPGDVAATFVFSQAPPNTGSALGDYATIATAPTSVNIVSGGGSGGSDRVYIVLPSGFTSNSVWLRVLVKSAGGKLGLGSDDVFYIGSARGKAANPSGGFYAVGSVDVSQIKTHPTVASPITDPNDVDRNSAAGSSDASFALVNPTAGGFTALKAVTVP